MIGKAQIQRAQPEDGIAWICFLDSGGRGLGPHGFGDTPAEAYENWLFDIQNDIGPHCDKADYSEARKLAGITSPARAAGPASR